MPNQVVFAQQNNHNALDTVSQCCSGTSKYISDGKNNSAMKKNKWSRILLSITNSRQTTNPLASIASKPVMNDLSVMPSIHRLAALCPFLCAVPLRALECKWQDERRMQELGMIHHTCYLPGIIKISKWLGNKPSRCQQQTLSLVN